jgi:hypothetical protein
LKSTSESASVIIMGGIFSRVYVPISLLQSPDIKSSQCLTLFAHITGEKLSRASIHKLVTRCHYLDLCVCCSETCNVSRLIQWDCTGNDMGETMIYAKYYATHATKLKKVDSLIFFIDTDFMCSKYVFENKQLIQIVNTIFFINMYLIKKILTYFD